MLVAGKVRRCEKRRCGPRSGARIAALVLHCKMAPSPFTETPEGAGEAMGETIRIAMDDGFQMPVYHADPEGKRRGGLVLVQEIFGVTEHIRELCDEYAGEGYEVLSPWLFERARSRIYAKGGADRRER